MALDWNQSKASYYADFALVPILCVAAASVVEHPADMLPGLPIGFTAWTLAEYWIHRSLFHRVLRREHWLHHLRPHAFVAAPAWLTALLHLFAGSVLTAAAGALGAGLFLGLEAGYLAYVATHDAIHHRRRQPSGWLRGKQDHHAIHHQGEEVNFGVVTHFWDRVFGTYWDPRFARPRPARGT